MATGRTISPMTGLSSNFPPGVSTTSPSFVKLTHMVVGWLVSGQVTPSVLCAEVFAGSIATADELTVGPEFVWTLKQM